MATPPTTLGTVGTLFTMGELVRRILRDCNEPASPKNQDQAADYINDAIESAWGSMLLASLSRFSKGPVSQVFSAGNQTQNLVTVADPTAIPQLSNVLGGNLGARSLYLSYCLVTDSGSTTLPCAPILYQPPGGYLTVMASPVITPSMASDVVGYYVFAGTKADGSDQGQQSPLIQIGKSWQEPSAGIIPAPGTPYAPSSNTTADNIFNIVRLDVQNTDMTWTQWIQNNLNSSWFTEFQHKVATSATFQPFCYDFISDRQIEVRPAPAASITGSFFYTTRPRCLRFAASRLPYPEFAITEFLHDHVMSKLLLGIYEYDASDRWGDKAEKARQRLILQVGHTNFNQNTSVRPFMR